MLLKYSLNRPVKSEGRIPNIGDDPNFPLYEKIILVFSPWIAFQTVIIERPISRKFSAVGKFIS